MANLAQAITGWMIIMGMVLGGVGVLFLVLSAIRSLLGSARRIRLTPLEALDASPIRAAGAINR